MVALLVEVPVPQPPPYRRLVESRPELDALAKQLHCLDTPAHKMLDVLLFLKAPQVVKPLRDMQWAQQTCAAHSTHVEAQWSMSNSNVWFDNNVNANAVRIT